MARAKPTNARETGDQAAVTELRAWLSSAAGKKRMRAAAAAAKKERERLSRSTSVASELLRAKVTI